VRTTQMLREMPDAQVRVSQAEALVRSARIFLFDSLDQLRTKLLATAGACVSRCPCDDAAHRCTAARHAVDSPGAVRPRIGHSATLTGALVRSLRELRSVRRPLTLTPPVLLYGNAGVIAACQCNSRWIRSSSTRATTSRSTVRIIRLRVTAVAAG
jgi:hypothetical protein